MLHGCHVWISAFPKCITSVNKHPKVRRRTRRTDTGYSKPCKFILIYLHILFSFIYISLFLYIVNYFLNFQKFIQNEIILSTRNFFIFCSFQFLKLTYLTLFWNFCRDRPSPPMLKSKAIQWYDVSTSSGHGMRWTTSTLNKTKIVFVFVFIVVQCLSLIFPTRFCFVKIIIFSPTSPLVPP